MNAGSCDRDDDENDHDRSDAHLSRSGIVSETDACDEHGDRPEKANENGGIDDQT